LKLLIGALDLRADITDNFTDVDKAAYYYDAVGTAKALGIVNGVGEGKFNPAAYNTRQDAMVMTARALKLAKGLKDGSENVL
jgi:N-acetylmuramoyl-L-alanine amidase